MISILSDTNFLVDRLQLALQAKQFLEAAGAILEFFEKPSIVSLFDGHVLSGRRGEGSSLAIANCALRLENPIAAVVHKLSFGPKFHLRLHMPKVSNIQFDAESESFTTNADCPDHDLIQNGGGDPPMNNSFETHVFRPGNISGANNRAIGLKLKLESTGIVFAANKTGPSAGKFLHTGIDLPCARRKTQVSHIAADPLYIEQTVTSEMGG